MEQINFSITLDAPKEKVWEALWEDSSYRNWTGAFFEGSYAETDGWKQGTKVLFLSPGGSGIVSKVAVNRPCEFMSFKHIGELKDGVEDTTSDKIKQWAGAMENYTLTETAGKTTLLVTLDVTEEDKDYFMEAWPKALEKIKTLVSVKPLLIERTYNAPVKKVWKAITDNNEMKLWYFDIADFKPEEGFEFSFEGEGKEGEKYMHLCKVTEVIPEKKLSHSWRYDGFTGNSLVTFELSAEGEKTKLLLTHSGIETFAVTASNAFARENFAEGWNYITGTSLKQFVEK